MDCARSDGCPSFLSCNHSINDGPAVVSLVSGSLSIISSLCIIITYFIWPEIRSISRQIIVFLSLADLFTALGYVIGSANYLQYGNGNDTASFAADCEAFTRTCVVQSSITTWSSMASFWWTTILAVHLYVTLVKRHVSLPGRFLPVCHLLAWVTPIMIVMPLLWTGQLGYSHVATSSWCFIKHQHHKFVQVMLILVGGKLWEILTYLIILILYSITKLHMRREVSVLIEYSLLHLVR